MEMTRPVVTEHFVVKEDPLGNYEDQEMCFYLPSKYQEDHLHHDDDEEEEDLSVAADPTHRRRRHAAEAPPPPLDDGKVYTFTRPALTVFVRLEQGAYRKNIQSLYSILSFLNHTSNFLVVLMAGL